MVGPGFGPNADAQVRTDNNKRPGIKPNLVVQQNFTVSLTFAKPDLYGFDDALYSAAAFGSVNVYGESRFTHFEMDPTHLDDTLITTSPELIRKRAPTNGIGDESLA